MPLELGRVLLADLVQVLADVLELRQRRRRLGQLLELLKWVLEVHRGETPRDQHRGVVGVRVQQEDTVELRCGVSLPSPQIADAQYQIRTDGEADDDQVLAGVLADESLDDSVDEVCVGLQADGLVAVIRSLVGIEAERRDRDGVPVGAAHVWHEVVRVEADTVQQDDQVARFRPSLEVPDSAAEDLVVRTDLVLEGSCLDGVLTRRDRNVSLSAKGLTSRPPRHSDCDREDQDPQNDSDRTVQRPADGGPSLVAVYADQAACGEGADGDHRVGFTTRGDTSQPRRPLAHIGSLRGLMRMSKSEPQVTVPLKCASEVSATCSGRRVPVWDAAPTAPRVPRAPLRSIVNSRPRASH